MDINILKFKIDEIYEDKKNDDGWEAWSALCLWIAQYENNQKQLSNIEQSETPKG